MTTNLDMFDVDPRIHAYLAVWALLHSMRPEADQKLQLRKLLLHLRFARPSIVARLAGVLGINFDKYFGKIPAQKLDETLECALDAGVILTPNIWVGLLEYSIAEKDNYTVKAVPRLQRLRKLQNAKEKSELDVLFDTSLELLRIIDPTMFGLDAAEYNLESAVDQLKILARICAESGRDHHAFDFDAAALALGPLPSDKTESIIRHALASALKCHRSDQVAECATNLAETIVRAADTKQSRQLEAFSACEVAIERIASAPQAMQSRLAEQITAIAAERPYLKNIQLLTIAYIEGEKLSANGRAARNAFQWPKRISDLSDAEWLSQFGRVSTAQRILMELDTARQKLEPTSQSERAEIDWFTWALDHPAYRNALPHSQSFLREVHYNNNILTLGHEVTHVFSLLGGLGGALQAIRVAQLECETTLWSQATKSLAAIESRIRDDGVAPLPLQQAGLLFRAEQGLDLTLKAHTLQDIWSPWLEGLAVFGEVAADPALDADAIGPIAEAIRGLVDFQPVVKEGDPLARQAAYLREFEEHSAKFEKQWSDAIRRHGPIRFDKYIRLPSELYFAGYLSVRSVVAQWRIATGAPLTAAQVFTLLLHATRYGTFDAIPDLSLPYEMFADQAQRRAQLWLQNLADLTKAELEDFLAPPVNGEPRQYNWEDSKLVRRAGAPDIDGTKKVFERFIREALSSLSTSPAANRVASADEECLGLMEMASGLLRRHIEEPAFTATMRRKMELLEQLMSAGALLPIGRVQAPFFLNIDPTGPNCRLALLIRTTEAHRDTSQSSANLLVMPIPKRAAELIRQHYELTAEPRVSIARIIDLAGVALPDSSLHRIHLLSYAYGDWDQVEGATLAANELIGDDEDHRQWLRRMVKYRIAPTPMQRVEQDVIANGRVGAERTRKWLDQSGLLWKVDDTDVSVGAWVSRVRALSDLVVTESDRSTRRKQAARDSISCLFEDQKLADVIVDKRFGDLIRGSMRGQVISALFETAMKPSASEFLSSSNDEIGLKIFESSTLGWDVRAATPTQQ